MIVKFLVSLFAVMCQMAPWLLLGFFLAGVLARLIPAEKIKRHFSGQGVGAVVKAALFGVPLPLCSCGVIPLAASLRTEGAGKGPTGAFFVATPQTGIDNFLITSGLLGAPAALLRAALAFASGLVSGVLIGRFAPDDPAASAPEPAPETPAARPKEKCCCCCCGHKPEPKRGPVAFFKFVLNHGFNVMMRDMRWSLLIGLAAAAVVALFVPDDFGAEFFAGRRWLEFLAMLVLGLPLYVCSNASVPLAAALLAKGVSPGAALVFLVVGPAANAASIAAMVKVLGGRATLLCLAAMAGLAVLAGIGVNCLDLPPDFFPAAARACSDCAAAPSPFAQVCGCVFALLLLRAFLRPRAG